SPGLAGATHGRPSGSIASVSLTGRPCSSLRTAVMSMAWSGLVCACAASGSRARVEARSSGFMVCPQQCVTMPPTVANDGVGEPPQLTPGDAPEANDTAFTEDQR